MSKRKHKPSILQEKDGRCLFCIAFEGDYDRKTVEEHHVYPGTANRRISEENGFKVYLCPEHHRTTDAAVHRNSSSMLALQKTCQKKYEETHTREEFIKLIGKSYL